MASMIEVYDMAGEIVEEITLESIIASCLNELEESIQRICSEIEKKAEFHSMIIGNFGTGKSVNIFVIDAMKESINTNLNDYLMDFDCIQNSFSALQAFVLEKGCLRFVGKEIHKELMEWFIQALEDSLSEGQRITDLAGKATAKRSIDMQGLSAGRISFLWKDRRTRCGPDLALISVPWKLNSNQSFGKRNGNRISLRRCA